MPMVEWFEFQVPSKVICAERCVDSIGTEMDKIGGSKIFLVTDVGVEKAGLIKVIEEGMESGSGVIVGTFNEVPPNSEVKVVERCYAKAKASGADAFISVGGGSVIDTTKATTILMCEGGGLLDHQSAVYTPTVTMPVHISVPTTAGTGSESTFAAVIADEDQELKLIFQGPDLAPTVSMLDPIMTKSLPPSLTASTGMDAMTHCIEALHSEMHEPITDGMAVKGIQIIRDNIVKSFKDGGDLEARKFMLIAANLGGVAFANAFVGIVHAMAHSVGGHFGVPHGVANSIFLPWGMEFNLRYEDVPGEYRMVAEALGLDVSKDDDMTASKKAIEYIKKLTLELGLPQTLSEMGVPEEGLEAVTDDAMIDGCMFNNPGEPEYDEVLALIKQAY